MTTLIMERTTVERIRAIYETGLFSMQQLADRLGLTKGTIQRHLDGSVKEIRKGTKALIGNKLDKLEKEIGIDQE